MSQNKPVDKYLLILECSRKRDLLEFPVDVFGAYVFGPKVVRVQMSHQSGGEEKLILIGDIKNMTNIRVHVLDLFGRDGAIYR